MRSRTLLVAGILALVVSVVFSGAVAAQADRDCADFASQADAQAFFGDSGAADPHRLDADNDGWACEHLPGPYAFGFGAGDADEVGSMPSTGTSSAVNATTFTEMSWLLVPVTLVIVAGAILGGLALRRQSS